MDTITSAEFRRRYATLDQPTIVTANGRPIGRWTPSVVPPPPDGPDADWRTVQAGDYFRSKRDGPLSKRAPSRWHQATVEREGTPDMPGPIYKCRCREYPWPTRGAPNKVVETQRERPTSNLCRALRS